MANIDPRSERPEKARPPPSSDTSIVTELSGEQALPNIPGYEVKRLLGTGGMARVFLAEDLSLKRLVALKMMNAQFSNDEQFCDRFEAEGQIVAGFRHPNIVTVYASGIADNARHIAMEYIAGGTLSERLRTTQMEERNAIAIARQVAEALGYSHRQGIIHRDLKPGNILFTQDNQPILSDFGIAKSTLATSSKTQTGQVIGSPRYMAPEQLMGKKVTTAVDVYALGIVIYEMLTGCKPPQELSSVENEDDAARLKDSLGPQFQQYGDLIAECLSRDVDGRPTADMCAARLAAFLNDHSPGHTAFTSALSKQRQKLQWISFAIVLVAVLITGLVVNWSTRGSAVNLIPVAFEVTPETAAIYVDGKALIGPSTELNSGTHQVLVIDTAHFGLYAQLTPEQNPLFTAQLEPLTLPSYKEFSEFHSRFHQETALNDVKNHNLSYSPFSTLLNLRIAYLQEQQTSIDNQVAQLKALADVGDPAAQMILFLANDEKIIQENYEQTVTWLRQASIQGYALATYYYALHYRGKKEIDGMLDLESMKLFRDIMALANRQGLSFAERFVQEADSLLSKGEL